jgi:hypothetical protein
VRIPDHHLNSALALVEPLRTAWLLELTTRYTTEAEQNAPRTVELARTQEPKDWKVLDYVKIIHPEKDRYRYISDRHAYAHGLARDGKVEPDYERARRDAASTVNGACDFFAARLSEKLTLAFGPLAPKLRAEMQPRGGVIYGNVTAAFDKHLVVFDATGMTNYRYGWNSRNRNMTVYAQYPMRVISAHIDGHGDFNGIGAEEVGSRILGYDVIKKVREENEQRKRATIEERMYVDRLEVEKRAYADIEWALKCIEDCETATREGRPYSNTEYITDRRAEIAKIVERRKLTVVPTTKEQAKVLAKERLAELKKIRAARKAAREAKA